MNCYWGCICRVGLLFVVLLPVLFRSFLPVHAEMIFVAPQFESFEAARDGLVEIRGKAVGFSRVELINGADTLGKADITEEGVFLICTVNLLKPGEYRLVLRATDENGQSATSLQTLVVSIPEQGSSKALALVEEPGKVQHLISREEIPRQDTEEDRKDFAIEKIALFKDQFTVCGKKTAGTGVSVKTGRNHIIGSVPLSDDTDFCIIRRYHMKAGDYVLRAEFADVSGNRKGFASVAFFIGSDRMMLTSRVYRGKHPVDTVYVQKGDTLSRLAKRLYGNSYFADALFRANQDTIRIPDKIYAGQQLVLPPLLAEKRR